MFRPTPFRSNLASMSGRRPTLYESAKLRWNFLGKIFAIISIQLIMALPVAAVILSVQWIKKSLNEKHVGIEFYFSTFVLQILVLGILYYHHQTRTWNYVLLGAFMFLCACMLGATCAYKKGFAVMLAITFSAVAFMVLTGYTFWAKKRELDFKVLPTVMVGLVPVILGFALIKLFLKMDKEEDQIINETFGVAILFIGYIVFSIQNVLRENLYEEHIWAAVSLYFFITHIFISVLAATRKEI